MSMRLALACAALSCVVTAPLSAQWVTLQGKVVFPEGKAVPAAKQLNVTADQGHCLGKGPLLDNTLLVNPKDRGVQHVWVYLRPDSDDRAAKFDPAKEIAPPLQKAPEKTFDVDQPCCMFTPRVFAIRSGDFVNFKNSSPVTHNTKLDANPPSPSFNKTVTAGQSYKDPLPFVAQNSPITFSCSIHPWMEGKFMVFDHPYFAVTDENGNFEIKDCPAGKYRIVYRHEKGFHMGAAGNKGWQIEIKAGADGKMKLEPLALELPNP